MKIALLGDVALFGKFDLENNSNAFIYMKDVSEFLKNYDYVIGNLETPFTELKKSFVSKSAHLKSSKKNIELLRHLNISIVNLSNNHIFDYGIKGFESTIDLLGQNKINYFGVDGVDHIIENSNICLSGFCCYSTNGVFYLEKGKKHGVNILNGYDVESKLKKDKEKGYLSILSVHCGDEHIHYPRYDHIRLARIFSEFSDYVFYGHHPHVMQGIEKHNNSLLAYSLGNFCFDDIYTKESKSPKIKLTKENKETFILELTIDDNKLISYKAIPIYDNGQKLVVDPENSEILNKIQQYSEYINIDEKDYVTVRSEKRKSYIEMRKSMRDLKFYLKRINLNSIGLILSSKRNSNNYKNNILDYLKEHE